MTATRFPAMSSASSAAIWNAASSPMIVFNSDLDMYAFVGIIMLIGIVKKNAILMIDFAIEAQRAGRSAEDAIFYASVTRFRWVSPPSAG